MLSAKLGGYISSRELIILVTLFLTSVLLIAVPPVEVAALPLWFYMAPALLAGYCVPFGAFTLALVIGATITYPLIGQSASSFIPESLVSTILLISIVGIRKITQRTDTLLPTIAVLLFGAFPLICVMNVLWTEMSVSYSVLMGARYAISSLVSILIAELILLLVTLTSWHWLEPLRQTLGFRPSLIQVIELAVSLAVGVSMLVSLSLFWRGWEGSYESKLRAEANMQFDKLYMASELALWHRLESVAFVAAKLESEDPATLLGAMPEIRAVIETKSDGVPVSGIEFGVVTESGQVLASDGLSTSLVRQGLAIARLKAEGEVGVFAVSVPTGESQDMRAHALIEPGLPGVLVVYQSPQSAYEFQYVDTLRLSNGLTIESVSASSGASGLIEDFGLPEDAQVMWSRDDYLYWTPEASKTRGRGRSFVGRLDESALVTFKPVSNMPSEFQTELYDFDSFRATVAFWPIFVGFSDVVSMSAVVSLAVLAGLLFVSRMLLGRMIVPLAELTQVFENWRQFRGGQLGSGSALQAMDARGFSSLEDIHNLQVGFRSLAQDVMYGERRLSTIAANYDELLRSLPLGVLAVDGASRVQFINDAMGEITEQRQEAINRLKNQAAQMLATNSTVEEWQLTFEDRSPRSLLLVVNHRLDDRGQESGLWVICTDLTEQKQTSAQLIQASKLATLGEMSTGMAHELNQPLNVISLATSNLRFTINKGKATPDNTLSKLDRIDGAVHRAASIIDHMRAYGRLAGEGLTEINVGEVVSGACKLLSEQLKLSNISLINEVPEDGLHVKGNAIQLEQVLINLINNAKDAIKEKSAEGSITVDCESDGNRVLLRVTDTGGGIPEHVLPHIFEPFFTTKPVGKGTGLGGSISYGIVREMQGDIWVENVTGGAQITISLPLMKQTQELVG